MKREVKIGIFAVAIICCSWAGIRFLSGIDVFGRSAVYYAAYDKINGISSASPILIQGVKVGKVTDIILDPAVNDKVIVKLSIDKGYAIPQNSVARIYSPGLMSSMAIGLVLGDSKTVLQRGDTIAADYEIGLMDIAAEKLMSLTEQFSTISEELTTTLTSVNSMLDENEGNINGTLANLSAISADIASLLKNQSENIEDSLAGLASFSATLGENADDFDKLITNLGEISDQLAQAELADSLSVTIAELNTTLGKINSAEGSAGMLLNDEQLYQNLSDVSGSLNELIVDMQANPKRYVHFSLFGSKDKSDK